MQAKAKPELVYPHAGNLYINLSGRCPTSCRFCIKFTWDMKFRGRNLALRGEPPVSDFKAEIKKQLSPAGGKKPRYAEAVFCGYGESTYRLKDMLALADLLHSFGLKTRLNTVGLGSLINGRDIVPELAGRLDAVSVSLNTANPARYVEMHRPLPEFRARAFDALMEFIAASAKKIPTTVTCIEQPGSDIAACERLAKSLGADFRVRPYLAAEDGAGKEPAA